jgi:photosynthetic reaction center cytochrome c subunit
MRSACVFIFAICSAAAAGSAAAQPPPVPGMVESPNVKVLTGLTVPEFENEMQLMTSYLGVTCGYCHTRGNFASETNGHKPIARTMLEMTKTINQQFFSDFRPPDGESRLGKVTCFTCHQGNSKPKTTP